jgi:hypothetical protein
LRYSGIFSKRSSHTNTHQYRSGNHGLIKALNNPSFLPHVKNLHNTAKTALQELSKAYKKNQEPASPRVEEAPRGVPSPRVLMAIQVVEHPALL